MDYSNRNKIILYCKEDILFMSAKHKCDICGKQVKSENELWETRDGMACEDCKEDYRKSRS